MAAMNVAEFARREQDRLGRRLTGIYTRTMLWYILGMVLLWWLGVESIYAHVTPFYAMFMPAFNLLAVPACMAMLLGFAYLYQSRHYVSRSRGRTFLSLLAWIVVGLWPLVAHLAGAPGRGEAAGLFLYFMLCQMTVLLVFLAGLTGLRRFLERQAWFAGDLSPRDVRRFLGALVVFSFAFACAVAMIRGGTAGIAQAYARQTSEMVGDIGKASSFLDMLNRYVEIQPFLSVHGRCHPPGPILLLWFFSKGLGNDPLVLSLCTVAFGALAVIPMYLWTREMLGQRVGLTAALVYALVPSVVLFQATSADTLFPPVTLATLWLFERALRRRSLGSAALAGLGYGVMGMMKYSLFGVGAYFGITGLWWLMQPGRRAVVFKTALVMGTVTVLFHAVLREACGFDLLQSMTLAKEFVDRDRGYEAINLPRYGFWAWRLLNPLCWFYFAGIPVSVLFLMRLRKAPPAVRGLCRTLAITALSQSLLYLGAGEGERSALYVFPFLVVPAAHALDILGATSESPTPLLATVSFLAFQCWFTECYFYTYW